MVALRLDDGRQECRNTRHFIPLPRSAVIGPTHTTPRFEMVSLPQSEH
jgi:hypothetical protein